MQRKIKCWLFGTSCFWLTSCAPTPPNVFVFEYLAQREYEDPENHHKMLAPSPTCLQQIGELECGHGVSIVTGAEIFVGENPKNWYKGKPWSQLRAESVFCPAEECYAPLGGYIINSCEKMHCEDQLTRFKVKLDSLKGVAGAIKNH